MRVSKLNEEKLKKYSSELNDFLLYGDCLEEDLANAYFDSIKSQIMNEMFSKNYSLTKYPLNEMTVEGFAKTLRKIVFNKKVIDSEQAMLNEIQKGRNAARRASYERNGEHKIVKNGSTHLELKPGDFCNKEQFRNAFSKEKFDIQSDMSELTPTVMMDEYLKAFDDDGWLISTVDTKGYEDIQSGKVKA